MYYNLINYEEYFDIKSYIFQKAQQPNRTLPSKGNSLSPYATVNGRSVPLCK
jgi:hypothetical protein